MATWSHRTVTSRREEWLVPTDGPWGAAVGDIQAAIDAAWALYRETHGLPADAPRTDDYARIHATDDEAVISVTTEHPTH